MPGLWDRYLLLQRQSFSEFRLAGLHQCFSQAIQALAGQAARCRREGAPMEEILKVRPGCCYTVQLPLARGTYQ